MPKNVTGGLGLEREFSLAEEISKRKEALLPDIEVLDFEEEEETDNNDDDILSEILDDIIIDSPEETTEETIL